MPVISKLHQTGDTIVEVMICLAIIGFGIASCYGIAHRSLYTILQSEEHSQSLQLAQGQIERFREYLSLNPSVTTNPTPTPPKIFILAPGSFGFCILNTSTGYKLQNVYTDPKSPWCAVNQAGIYYCEKYSCPGLPLEKDVNNAGFTFRAGVAYCYGPCGVGAVEDQFYGLAGRYAVNGQTSNSADFDVVTVQYRIHQ